MVATEEDLVNLALVRIGETTISDLDGSGRVPETAKVLYAQERDALLQSYNWRFAIEREQIDPEQSGGEDITPTAAPFEKQYLLSDLSATLLRPIGIYDENEPDRNYTSTKEPWKVEGQRILANVDPLDLVFIKQVTTVTEFDPMFTQALACKLAVNLAYALSTGLKRVNQLNDELIFTIRQARHIHAIQGSPEVIVASDWLDARGTDVSQRYRIGPVVI